MIDKALLDILCCPETKQNIEYIEGKIIQRINDEISKGNVKNRANEPVSDKIDAGLLRKDRKYLYPIRDDIPIMLIDEALCFEPFDEPK